VTMRPCLIMMQLFVMGVLAWTSAAQESGRPDTPRIDCVVPLAQQPHAEDPTTIWYDDFDGQAKSYAEGGTFLDQTMSFGLKGGSMRCLYEKGKRGKGGAKVFFGDSPCYPQKAARRGEQFDEVYWRIYVKHQYGWVGAPAKMSRATSMASAAWSQAMISHVWSGAGASLTLDPVRGVAGDLVVTRKYNDFDRMTWLGNRPASTFPIHATEESGYWVLVEARVELNTPGKSDGINQLWIDGRLECERRNLNLRGAYTGHGINAVFLEAYWNDRSPVTQSRWYDNFVIATKPIGPVVCAPNPTVIKTPYRGPGIAGGWQVEVAADYSGKNVVFRSRLQAPGSSMVIDRTHGAFVGKLTAKSKLVAGHIYYLRVRQQSAGGIVSDWSRWHQGFKVPEM